MNSVHRRAEDCPQLFTIDAGRRICREATRLIGRGSAAETQAADVGLADCQACCQFPEPSVGGTNPALAALVYRRARAALSETSLPPMDRIRCREAIQFVLPLLRRDDDRLCDSTAPVRSPAVVAELMPDAGRMRGREERHRRIGLVGINSAFGLGHINRDLVKHLPIDRWLLPSAGATELSLLSCRVDVLGHPPSDAELEAWLNDLDVLLFVESPVFDRLPAIARQMGVRVVCSPNWEWLHPGIEWLADVDLMLCPSRITAAKLRKWNQRFGFQWQVAQIDWPIDVNNFGYRNRRYCRQFVFVNGSGGVAAQLDDDRHVSVRRKGLAVLLEAAALIPGIPIIVYATLEDVVPGPPNVEFRPLPDDNRLLYCDGDVCVQPSHWEGLGLPLLECQAAGMPLISTAAAPMNEHQPFRTVSVAETKAGFLTPQLCIPMALICPGELARVIASVFGTNISRASRNARRFVERHHNWSVAVGRIHELIFSPNPLTSGT